MIRFVLGLVFIASTVLPVVVQAATFSVTPMIIDEQVEPRDIITKDITLTNTGSVPMRLYASVNEIVTDEGGGIKEFVPPSMADGSVEVTSWIEVSRARVLLQPGDSATVPVTLRISPYAKPGTYQAYIGYAPAQNRDEARAQVLAGNGTGVVVRLSIEEEVNALLRLSRFAVDRFMTTLRDHTVSYVLENPGDVPMTPTGEVIVYNTRGEEVKSFALNTDNITIAPGETKEFSIPVDPGGLFGRYKAYLSLEYGETQRAALYDTTFFYAVPVPVLVGIFAIIFVFVLSMLFMLRHRFVHEHDDDHDGHVTLYVRPGSDRVSVDHDIDLKNSNNSQ